MSLVLRFVAALGILLLVVGCDTSPPPPPVTAAPEGIATTFYPITDFARRIAGDLVEVVCPLPDDEDPIFWSPSDEAIRAYQAARVILVNGAGFEQWVSRVSLPRDRVVETAARLDAPFITYQSMTHQHGLGGAHTHEGIDGHTWVDPVNAVAQADVILDAVVKAWPDHAATFRTNHAALVADLRTLDARLVALAPRMRETTVLCSHPAYNYLARRYGWTVTNFGLDPEAPLSDADIDAIVARIGPPDRPTLLLWESAPLAASVSALEAAGIRNVVFSPMEHAPDGGRDYVAAMRDTIAALAASVGAE
ncbi:MAG: zinc ABC transporter substrate-binding protein [Phycisphaerales bacterium]|nr:zinc ABC transporter substrate-binding protein [Phycisphaerales bacterium]